MGMTSPCGAAISLDPGEESHGGMTANGMSRCGVSRMANDRCGPISLKNIHDVRLYSKIWNDILSCVSECGLAAFN